MRSRSWIRQSSHWFLAALVASGCTSNGGDAGTSARPGTPIFHAGGQGDDVTARFSTKSSGVRIDYRLTQASSRPQIIFTVEQDGGNGLYNPVSTVERPVTGRTGSTSFSLIPGTYRIRIETDVPWSADVYEAKP